MDNKLFVKTEGNRKMSAKISVPIGTFLQNCLTFIFVKANFFIKRFNNYMVSFLWRLDGVTQKFLQVHPTFDSPQFPHMSVFFRSYINAKISLFVNKTKNFIQISFSFLSSLRKFYSRIHQLKTKSTRVKYKLKSHFNVSAFWEILIPSLLCMHKVNPSLFTLSLVAIVLSHGDLRFISFVLWSAKNSSNSFLV